MDSRYAYIAGGATGVLLLAAVWAVGSLSGGEALGLLEATLPTIRFLCSTTGTASATILALMLAVLSFSDTHDGRFKEVHYRRVRQIAAFSIITLITSIFLLMILAVPLSESDNVPIHLYTVLYYLVLGFSALLGGLLVMVALMLFQAISNVVTVIHPDADSPILEDEREAEPAAS